MDCPDVGVNKYIDTRATSTVVTVHQAGTCNRSSSFTCHGHGHPNGHDLRQWYSYDHPHCRDSASERVLKPVLIIVLVVVTVIAMMVYDKGLPSSSSSRS